MGSLRHLSRAASALGEAIALVCGIVTQEEVRRVDTRWIVAMMQDPGPMPWPSKQFPRNRMGMAILAVKPEPPIAILRPFPVLPSARPYPASGAIPCWAIFINVPQKSSEGVGRWPRFVRHGMTPSTSESPYPLLRRRVIRSSPRRRRRRLGRWHPAQTRRRRRWPGTSKRPGESADARWRSRCPGSSWR